MRIRALTLAALVAGCVVEDTDPAVDPVDETDGWRGVGDATACLDLDLGTCRIDQLAPCTAVEVDACDTAWQPSACYAPGASCEIAWPGEECPPGWYDACAYFGP
jgi:hypothetical protein